MKGQFAVQEKNKRTVLPASRFLQHAAVRPVADHSVQPGPAGAVTESRFGQDFSQVAVHSEPIAARAATTQHCPLTPTRCPFGGACHTCPVPVQAKLAIARPGDEYEQEADRVADQLTGALGGQPQRRAASQVRPTHVPPIVHEVLRSPGQPLDAETRVLVGSHFGRDFSGVRVHADEKAAESARAVSALAYTVGRDVVFGEGQYTPHTSTGRRLLAHELTHVVQQSGSNGLHIGQVGEKRGLTPIAHIIQQSGKIDRQAVPSPTPAATAVGTADITLETGNIGAGFLNNLVHQQICVDRYGPGRKRCFSFAAIGAQLPQFSSTWLGWSSWVTGAILKGEVYEPSPVSGATIVSRHTPKATQGAKWLGYMLSTRLGLQDGYSVARHNCRTFSQWEFRDAPSHW
jgi:ferredoxin